MKSSKIKILVVEDNPVTLDVVVKRLQQERDFIVISESDGSLAFEKILKEKPSLVILDVMIPSISGLQVCMLVKRNPDAEIANTRIIFLTAKAIEIDKIIGLDAGADDYIIKPFGLEELVTRVRTILRRSSSASNLPVNKIAYGDIEVDFSGRICTKGGQNIKMTKKEIDLLYYLMRFPNMVISRDNILSSVWQTDFVDQRTVDVHIRWIREKIEDDPSKPQRIVTIRGIGYKFIP